MRYLYLFLTLSIQYLCVYALKLLDNPALIFCIFVFLLAGGIIATAIGKKGSAFLKDLGWGLLYGSLTSVILVVIFLVWLSFNFPR